MVVLDKQYSIQKKMWNSLNVIKVCELLKHNDDDKECRADQLLQQLYICNNIEIISW